MAVLSHVPVGFPAIAYCPCLPFRYTQLNEALCSLSGSLPLFPDIASKPSSQPLIPSLHCCLHTDEYEVISGHRRLHAAQKAGITEIPALIYALDRDAAVIAVVDSNLHREHILPSEKAFAYKLKMEALSHQGKRTDLTLSQVATRLDTATEIENCSGESRDTVYRYIRLTYLIPELLDLMDEGKIALMVGEALSYLGDEGQYAVLEQCEMSDCTPSYAQAVEMKKRYQDGNLTAENISEILSREKANQRETIKIPTEKLRKYAPNADAKQLEDFILKACDHYRKYLIRQRNRDER